MDDTREPTHLRGIGAFGMIPEWLLVADISSTAKVLFGWLGCKYANRATWACWPGQARLAADLRVSVGTIASALKELQDVGAITKRRRVDADGSPATNYYQLIFLSTHEKLGIHQKTVGAYPQKTVGGIPQKTVDKPEVLEPEVLEREVPAPLAESPLRWHKRHASHVTDFCDWMCFPQELANQFATRAGMADGEVLAWAKAVRQKWQETKQVPVGSMYDWWNARWTERQAPTESTTAVSGSRLARYYAEQAERAAEKVKRQEAQREETRKEMARIEQIKREVWGA